MVPAGVAKDPQTLKTPLTPLIPQATSRRSERFQRRQTLRRTNDFRRCYAEGRRKGGSLLVLHSLKNTAGAARFGQTASRKVGNAVVRHRLKRWAREIYRRWPERGALPEADLIAHFKPGAAGASFADFRRELERLLATLLPPATPASAPSGRERR